MSVQVLTLCSRGMSAEVEVDGKKRATEFSVTGIAQIENATIMARVLSRLVAKLEVDFNRFLDGMRYISHPGRMEVIHEYPTVMIDGAHNPDAARKLKESLLRIFPKQRFNFIIGVFSDKEYEEELSILLPYAKKVYTIKPDLPRGLESDVLAIVARKYCDVVEDCKVASLAIQRALAEVTKDEIIIVFGSLSFLKEIKEGITQHK